MKNSRLAHILKTFSKKEVREFSKWLDSPAHNQREDVVLLFNFLNKRDYLYKDKFLLKERVFPEVYPKETYDDAKMRQVIFFLLKQVENFLIYRELMEDEVRSKTTLASVYRKRHLDKSCEKTLRIVEDLQEKHPFRNEQFLRNDYLLQREKYGYLSGFQRTTLNLQETSEALDATFIADKLRQSCLMLSHQNVFKTEYQIGLLTEILNYVEQKDALKIPAISIYYYGYKTMTDQENDEHFFFLKKEINSHGQIFPEFEIRNIYLMAINYCIKKMNTGNKLFIREAFELFKTGFNKQFLIENKTISKATFLNVNIIGIQLGEFDWVKNFIQNFQQYLEPRYQENIVNYSFGHFYYEKGDYDKSMGHLMQYEIDDILLNLNSKSMLIKMYYEQEEFDALESLLNSSTTYLARKKVIGYHKAGFSNLLKLAKKLLKINPYDKLAKKKLKVEVENTNPLTPSNRNWLLLQLENLR
ncbi:MAG: hypothetical protein ACI9XO_001168 [Paraglaciecola sp.]|jgi:hypothetical protein